ncbi:MAG TPA: hypothetical protein VGO91_00270 [Pyrinomonadaceae bacterium]|jgi:hypothetical protein|nr:hypothetical protein [Pyrinomonadaceae bacterium]
MNEETKTGDLGVLKAAAQLLTFCLTREEFQRFNYRHLIFGLVSTWIVGMGRWWDDPGASLLQHLGVGSLIYIFILSFILWLGIYPLKPKHWSYRHVLTFVTMTSPPAILYAIPVEKFFALEVASSINLLFLLIVASWRVALLVHYLKRHAQLRSFPVAVSTLLPITAIILTLTILNLERAAFMSMGGFRGEPTSHDSAYGLLSWLSLLSVLLFIPLVLFYIGLIVQAQQSVDYDDGDS